MSNKKKSDVWNFFKIKTEDITMATCMLCKKNISRGGKSQTTSNLNKHLKTFHSIELMKFKQGSLPEATDFSESEIDNLNKESSPSGSSDTLIQSSLPSTSSTFLTSYSPTPNAISCKRTVQPTLTSVLNKKRKLLPDSEQSKTITRKITEMICLDNQPFSLVEDEGFKRLINHLEPRYSIPGRKYFTKEELPKLYEKTKKNVVHILKTAKHVSLTTDLWTSTANDDYLAITCHFYDDEFKWNHICLEVIPFPEISHTSEAISNFITEILNDWNILQKCHVIVRDNGKNVVSAMEKGKFKGIPCLAHTLQLVVKDGLLRQKSILALTSLCRRVVGHFKHSSRATKQLKAAQEALSLPQHRLVQDEPTRWNATKHMLDRLLEQRSAIAVVTPELNLQSEISGPDWELMSKVVTLLKIFDDATFQCSSSTTTISEIIPIINSAKKFLNNSISSNSGLKTFASSLLLSLQERYCDLETTKEYTIATVLDPRLKGTVFLSVDNLNSTKQLIIEEADELMPSTEVSSEESSKKSAKGAEKSTIWQQYSLLMESPSPEENKKGEVELKHYLMEPLEQADSNVGVYWKFKKTSFPRLSALAIKYLSAPPATVFSERLFSTSGLICDKKRNRLDPYRVRMLVFLNKNLRLNPDFKT